MYLTVTYSNSDKKRYISVSETLSVAEVTSLISVISVCPGVDKVWLNCKEPGSNEKTNNNSGNS